MTDYEKIDAGMRLMAEGCAEAKSCGYCPFRKLCDKQPSDWFDMRGATLGTVKSSPHPGC